MYISEYVIVIKKMIKEMLFNCNELNKVSIALPNIHIDLLLTTPTNSKCGGTICQAI